MEIDRETLLAKQLVQTIGNLMRSGRQQGSYQEIKQSEFMLLITLIETTKACSKGVKVSDLSSKLGITSAGVTHMINSLEQNGYVERHADPSDRRLVLVKASAKGEDLFTRLRAEKLEFVRGLVRFLGEKDSEELIRIMSAALNYSKERRKLNAGKSET